MVSLIRVEVNERRKECVCKTFGHVGSGVWSRRGPSRWRSLHYVSGKAHDRVQGPPDLREATVFSHIFKEMSVSDIADG
jgi:hypothetical protein